VGECRLTGMLASIIYIDLVNLDERDAQRVLIDGLNLWKDCWAYPVSRSIKKAERSKRPFSA
jgi:hypothetical protein